MKFQKEICIKNGKNMRARTHTRTQTRILTAERMRHMLHLSASQGIDLVMGHLGVSVKAWPWAWRHGRWCGRMRRRGSGQHSRAAGAEARGKGRIEIKMIFNLTRLRAAICLAFSRRCQ